VHLLIEELPADLVLPGQLGDRFSPGEHLDGQPLPLLRRQLLSRTRNMNSCRSWPMKRSRSRSGITLRDRDRQSSLTIHVCFLHETQFVRTNDANMEEAGILEKITRSGFCYPALNQVLCWGAFLPPPASSLQFHWPLITILPSHAPRPTPGPAGSGRAQTLPRWLQPDTDSRIGKDRTGPDRDERSLSFSMAPNRAIPPEKSIRFSSLAATQP